MTGMSCYARTKLILFRVFFTRTQFFFVVVPFTKNVHPYIVIQMNCAREVASIGISADFGDATSI